MYKNQIEMQVCVGMTREMCAHWHLTPKSSPQPEQNHS